MSSINKVRLYNVNLFIRKGTVNLFLKSEEPWIQKG